MNLTELSIKYKDMVASLEAIPKEREKIKASFVDIDLADTATTADISQALGELDAREMVLKAQIPKLKREIISSAFSEGDKIRAEIMSQEAGLTQQKNELEAQFSILLDELVVAAYLLYTNAREKLSLRIDKATSDLKRENKLNLGQSVIFRLDHLPMMANQNAELSRVLSKYFDENEADEIMDVKIEKPSQHAFIKDEGAGAYRVN